MFEANVVAIMFGDNPAYNVDVPVFDTPLVLER
jgi:hypothetical protein